MRPLEDILRPGDEKSFEYRFITDAQFLEPRPYGLAVKIDYRTEVRIFALSLFINRRLISLQLHTILLSNSMILPVYCLMVELFF